MDKIKIPLQGTENEKEKNFKERVAFIDYWARFVKTHPDAEWSKGQNMLINSQIASAREFYRKLAETKEGREKIRALVRMLCEKGENRKT